MSFYMDPDSVDIIVRRRQKELLDERDEDRLAASVAHVRHEHLITNLRRRGRAYRPALAAALVRMLHLR